jgi:hypothetical protein
VTVRAEGATPLELGFSLVRAILGMPRLARVAARALLSSGRRDGKADGP